MIWKLALAAILAFNVATWTASLIQDEPPPSPTTTVDDDKGYSIDPNG